MKSILLKFAVAVLALLAVSCAPGTGVNVNFFPAVPTGGGGCGAVRPHPGNPPQNCGNVVMRGGNPMMDYYNSQGGRRMVMGPNGPIDPRYLAQRGNPRMPLNWTNNYPNGGREPVFAPGGMPYAGQGRYDARMFTQGGRGFNPDNPNIGYEGGAIDPRTGRPFRRNVGNFGNPGDASVMTQ